MALGGVTLFLVILGFTAIHEISASEYTYIFGVHSQL